jgi:hypothetical protein
MYWVQSTEYYFFEDWASVMPSYQPYVLEKDITYWIKIAKQTFFVFTHEYRNIMGHGRHSSKGLGVSPYFSKGMGPCSFYIEVYWSHDLGVGCACVRL